MRAVPDSFDPAVVAEIDSRLAGLGVAIPWAIESGSRAWGFPSPDSDYDCRFFYVRPADAYLSPWPERDVIETPLDRIFDVNGWDLIKAVRLLVKGNAVVTEWLRSPIVYTGDTDFRDELLELAEQVADRILIARHYLHVGLYAWKPDADDMSIKKILYSVRPAAVLNWMSAHPASALPPMNLHELLADSDVPNDARREIDELLAQKAVTRELGRGTVPPAIARFVNDELASANEKFARVARHPSAQARALGDAYFRMAVDKYGR